jgi:hypothetical protein
MAAPGGAVVETVTRKLGLFVANEGYALPMGPGPPALSFINTRAPGQVPGVPAVGLADALADALAVGLASMVVPVVVVPVVVPVVPVVLVPVAMLVPVVVLVPIVPVPDDSSSQAMPSLSASRP